MLSVAKKKNKLSHSENIQGLAKGLTVIAAFGSNRPDMTIADAAKATGMTRATVRRVFLTLESMGYATEDGRRRWMLTPRILELGFSYLSSIKVWDLAYPIMRRVSEATGEACSVTVLDGDSSVYIARVPANRVMSVTLGVGSRLPAWVSSHGRVHLSEMPEDELERFLRNQPRRQLTPYTVWEIAPLVEQILGIREVGYSLVIDELELGVMALAVPIRDRRGNLKAALHISTLSSRTRKEKAIEDFLPQLLGASREIQMLIP